MTVKIVQLVRFYSAAIAVAALVLSAYIHYSGTIKLLPFKIIASKAKTMPKPKVSSIEKDLHPWE